MTKEEVGERVREGIEADELYICTHQEFLRACTERAEAIVACEPRARGESRIQGDVRMLFRNDGV